MVVFASLTALAYTASIFRYVGYGRDRIQATGIANRVMEDIRGLAYTKITNGIPDSSSRATAGSSTAPASTGSSPVRVRRSCPPRSPEAIRPRGSCRIGPR